MPEYKKELMYAYLIVLTICSTAGLQCWRTLFDNFSVHVVRLDGYHVGVLQSVREIPGFLALLVTYVILIIKEHKLSALSILIMGIGVFLTGLLPSFSGLIFTTLVMSFGFHYFETTNQSLTLQYYDKLTSPLVFSAQRSYAAAANVVVGILIFLIAPFLSYTAMYILFGTLIIAGGIWAFTKNPVNKDLIVQKKQMVLKKRYWLFYFLTFMAGARRQIFMAFAVFLLVKKFEFSIQQITLLFIVNNIINFFINPYIGRFIVKYGERKLLSIEYFSLVLVFISYAFVEAKLIAGFLYILDHIFFNFSTGISTYFQKIADPRDIASSAAVGFTINHIAAVVLPVLGGLLWMIDYKIPFIAGAVFSFISLCLVQLIRTDKTAS
ncbi:MAG: MFS transporter [Proteobacteria bacterium]|nr:MFS transporter [Pseudomonadota bacterium]MBU1583783.1 MFS transporter [Pseudomonadota bacterium]MBU2453441.1 MFS transporter [Pseudomonadota bacterium]MBU2631623.1 MFS transporter [Pseudomonadota bacterium]